MLGQCVRISVLILRNALHHRGDKHAHIHVQTTGQPCRPARPFFFFLSSSLLCLSCSHCYAFPSAVSVRRSCSWKHPQSCIFVNWRGSGGGGCCEGRREGGGCQQIAWLTFQPQIIAWCKCTLAGLWVCMCVHRWARRLSETLISFSLRLVLWVLFKSVKHPKLKLIAVVHTLVCVV